MIILKVEHYNSINQFPRGAEKDSSTIKLLANYSEVKLRYPQPYIYGFFYKIFKIKNVSKLRFAFIQRCTKKLI